MKIKLAILEKDQSYLNKIVTVFSTRYADKFEMYSFTDSSIALATIESAKIDILVANALFDIDFTAIPKRCAFAYFVDSPNIDTFNDRTAICKFQKVELIYKQILGIYSECAENVFGLKAQNDSAKLFSFASPAGGVGTSSVAAACARYYAAKGSKVLYLNLEKYGSSDVFFAGEGQFDMSDVIYALKSKKANLAMKLESCVKKDSSGVCFYSSSKIALDMLELSFEDISKLINELKLTGFFDVIILDMDFSLDPETIKLYKQAHSLILVSDGSKSANTKIRRAYNALTVLEQAQEMPLQNNLGLIYNKFSNKTGEAITDIDIKNIGGAPKFEHATTEQVLAQLSSVNMFEKI